jgi:hypothetical protein
MTEQQLRNKIGELEYWLEHNHNHVDRSAILSDIRKLREQLIALENGQK